MSGERNESRARPERMGALARLPLFFSLQGKRAVIAGGSPAAAWKAELLLATGARVDVCATDPCAELVQLAADHRGGNIVLHRRAWTAADLPGAALAVGDCRDDDAAARFAAAARHAGVPVNVIDKPAHCDFSFGAIVNRSPLVIGISTDGAAPVFARAIRGRLEALLPRGFARWTVAAAAWRAAVQAWGLSFAGRRRFWELFASHALANADDEPGHDDFERFIAEARGGNDHSLATGGAVTVVDVESDDPDSLTLGTVRALQAADIIVFDEDIPHRILDFARREAKKIRAGKTQPARELDAVMAGFQKQGARLVRLHARKSGNAARALQRVPRRAAPHLVPDDFMTGKSGANPGCR
jgi:uroporphyrin-III C-methyltransferase / precorrin-2 dehydrogenase / sirohydrochlorin ferrochelatase